MTTINPAKKFAQRFNNRQRAKNAQFFGAQRDVGPAQRRGLRPIPNVAQPIP